jgi:hypothetical protein
MGQTGLSSTTTDLVKLISGYRRLLECCLIVFTVSMFFVACGHKSDDLAAANLSDLRMKVVGKLQSHELKPDSAGAVLLPAELAAASAGGKVFVSPDGKEVVFVTAVTPQGATNALLYSEDVLSPSTRKVEAGSVQWGLQMPVDQHWRMVSTR